MMKSYTFPKESRLSHKKSIDLLFGNGVSFNSGLLRILYVPENNPAQPGLRVLVSVPRKKFRKAVARNRIKRLIREAFRLNRNQFIFPSTVRLNVAFIYIGDKAGITYQEIEPSVISSLEMIRSAVSGL